MNIQVFLYKFTVFYHFIVNIHIFLLRFTFAYSKNIYDIYLRFYYDSSDLNVFFLAEEEGFEPSNRLPRCLISSQVLSTTQPLLRGCA